MPRSPRTGRLLAWTSLVGAVFLAGCSPETEEDCTLDGGCTRTDAGSIDAPPGVDAIPIVDRSTARPTDLVSIALTPANPVLELAQGARTTLPFTVTATQRNGVTRPLSAGLRYTLANESLGALNPLTGVFLPSGVGGESRVRVATTDGSALTAETNLTVRSTFYVLGAGVSMADRAMLDLMRPSPATAMGPHIDNPLADAVMPRNVYPPSVMWTPRHPMAGATDLYRVRMVRPHSVVEGYFVATASFQHNWQLPAEAWSQIAQSDLAEPIRMTVSALSRGTLWQSDPLAFRTVDGVIAGSVYYWSPSRARLVRLDVDSARRVEFLPNPGDTCIGCHSVSRDGTRLAGFLEGRSENVAVYDLARDLTANPAPTIANVRTGERRCTSWNRDNTRLIAGDCGANPTTSRLSMLDSTTGMPVAVAGGVAAEGFDPEWSPDNNFIAYTDRRNNLAVLPVMPGDTFGASTVVHMANTTPGGAVDWHPTFTPDSRWMVFQHGDSRRTATEMPSGSGVRGALFMIAREGGTPVRLDNLNGGAMGVGSYRAVFSPFNSGGYFWLLFTSTRSYGNMPAGVRNSKQIWVAAIRNRPDGTTDASEVPYYLAGQEAVTSLSPYWTPAPCRPNGRTCATGADCCSGECEPDMTGARMCQTPTGQCHMRGQMCSASGDCCNGLVCTDGRICDTPPPA